MKNILKYITCTLFVLLTLYIVSCESDDELLKETPNTFYTVDNVFSTSAQIDQILIGIYGNLRELWGFSQTQWILNWRNNGTDMFDVPSVRRGNSFNNYGVINPDNSTFYQVFSNWYFVIQRANLALYASEMPKISWSSDAEKTYIIAQAKFFRAFAYRNLAELFGGVPIVTEVSTTPKFDFNRATRVETYKFAIDELEAIENDFPEVTPEGGRLVKGAVQHNLCELYLAMGTQLKAESKDSEAQAAFSKSISFGNKVIDGGTYSLITARFGIRKNVTSIVIPVYSGGNINSPVDTIIQTPNYYWDLFQDGNINFQDGNKECIWAMQVDYAAFKAGDTQSKLPFTRVYGPSFRDNTLGHLKGMLEDVGGRGVIIIIPTMYTRDIIYSNKWSNDMRNSEIVFRRRFKGNQPTSPYFKSIVPWDVLYNGAATSVVNTANRSINYPFSCKITTDMFTGIADGEKRENLYRDNYFIRLSETILLRAEAKQRSGDKIGAANDINLLRARAQCSYLVTAADMDDNFNLILDERARELVYEECRWNTLLRMGGTLAVDRIKSYAYWPETMATLNFNYNLWPIPQTVIDANSEIELEQNPGW